MKKILSFKNINLKYHAKQGEISALSDLSFDVFEEEFVAIVGPSGCGKTSILSLIAGLIKESNGEILFFGKEFEDENSIGYMFQKDYLFDWLTVEKNVMLGPNIQKLGKDKEVLNFVNNLLKKYELWEFKKNLPKQLSGGMKQRVALIRTLALNPKLLLLDEPFSALDYQTRLKVSEDVLKIIKKEKKTAILVTHDISEAISMADRVIVLSTRPAKIKCIFDININNLSPLKRRENPEFHKLFDKIWEVLQSE